MSDDFEATFIVELAPKAVWDALTRRTVRKEGADVAHYVLAGFPSFAQLEVPGASCSVLEIEPERLLRLKKDDEPCAGTEIAITLEQSKTGTRVTVVQSGFGPFLEWAGKDTVFGHGHQIVADLRLYIERGLTVPGTNWGAQLGLRAKQTPTGLEVFAVDASSVAEGAGIRVGDLILTLRGIRIHDLQQLWTVLALTDPGSTADLSWARGDDQMSGKATFAA